jgi:hypothetical protein
MKYVLLVHGIEDEEDTGPQDAEQESEPCWMPWYREMTAHGVGVGNGAQLLPSRTATTVRADGMEVLVADGPFAETKEQILGVGIVECTNLDEAIYAATRHPIVAEQGGAIEVRPLLEMS